MEKCINHSSQFHRPINKKKKKKSSRFVPIENTKIKQKFFGLHTFCPFYWKNENSMNFGPLVKKKRKEKNSLQLKYLICICGWH